MPPKVRPDPTPAARIRALMDEQGATVSEVAARTGLDRAGLSRWLNGHKDLSSESLAAVLDALGVRWGDLDAVNPQG